MIANEACCFSEMLDAVWLRSQKTRKEEVRGDGIIAQQNGVQHFCGTVERSVAFHYDDAVRDDKVRTDGSADIQNAFVNSDPMKDVLRPAIARSRHNAKHVLHAERDTGPVMALTFGIDTMKSDAKTVRGSHR